MRVLAAHKPAAVLANCGPTTLPHIGARARAALRAGLRRVFHVQATGFWAARVATSGGNTVLALGLGCSCCPAHLAYCSTEVP